jgi:hypothetical protein
MCTCPEYSCKVLVEISLYFKLQKKIVAVYRDRKLQFLSEICIFAYFKVQHIFLQNFYRAFGMFICICIFNSIFFIILEICFSSTCAHVPKVMLTSDFLES